MYTTTSRPALLRVTRRRWMTCIAVALSVAALPVAALPVAAQESASTPLAPGSRVRVRLGLPPDALLSEKDRWSGDLVRLDADSIVLRFADRTMAIPRARVLSLDVRVGERSTGRAMLRGALIGGAIGALAGVAIGAADGGCEPEQFCILDRSDAMGLGGLLFGGVGAILGGAAGAATGRDRWREVPLAPDTRVGLALTPRGAGLAIRF